MRRLLTASALFALAILTTAATGQPPPADKKTEKAEKTEKVEKKATDSTDAALAAALANDPDVRVARAKIQLAEAELAKARQAVTLKVLAVRASVEESKVTVAQNEERAAWAERMFKTGMIAPPQVIAEREKLAAAKAALARAEAEWKLLTGSATAAGAGPTSDKATATALAWLGIHAARDDLAAERLASALAAMDLIHARVAVKGPIPDRIRAALDKPVKLAEKGQHVQFQAACEAFKKAGLDVPIRQKQKGDIAMLTSEGEELPIGAWLQFFLDETPGTVMVVREYGILVTDKASAPPDAPTVFEFWKQKAPAAKDAKPETPK